MTALGILVEHHDSSNLTALEQAWSSAPTFAFLPEKAGISRQWIEEALEALPDDLRTGHFALLTSGSTGSPKLVLGQKERAEALARVLHQRQDSEPVSATILALPLTYCYAFVNQWLWARVMGRKVVRTRGLADAGELGRALRETCHAMICLVRIQLPLLAETFAGEAFPAVSRVHFAGGTFPQANLPVVKRLFPNATVFNNYGCAEAMPRLALRRADEADDAADIGAPLPSVELRTSAAGELQFRSPYAAVACFDERGFHRLASDWIGTGDLGVMDGQGHWHLTGRLSEVFKRHGEKISLPMLLESVQRVWHGGAAFYREHDPAGEDGHILVVAPHPAEDELRALLQVFRTTHMRAHWPLRVESVEELPTLANGKVDGTALPFLREKMVRWRQRLG